MAGDLWPPPGSLRPLRSIAWASRRGGGGPFWTFPLLLILHFYFSINLLPVYLNLSTNKTNDLWSFTSIRLHNNYTRYICYNNWLMIINKNYHVLNFFMTNRSSHINYFKQLSFEFWISCRLICNLFVTIHFAAHLSLWLMFGLENVHEHTVFIKS